MDKLVSSFMIILRENFDVWRALRPRDRPRFWSSLTPKMQVDVVLWKLENTVLTDTQCSDYAEMVSQLMIKRNFDSSLIDNHFSLAENRQAKVFVNELLSSYIVTTPQNAV